MKIENKYKELIANPINIIGNMSYDEYIDWLEIGSTEDLKRTLIKFKESNVPITYINVLSLVLDKKL